MLSGELFSAEICLELAQRGAFYLRKFFFILYIFTVFSCNKSDSNDDLLFLTTVVEAEKEKITKKNLNKNIVCGYTR